MVYICKPFVHVMCRHDHSTLLLVRGTEFRMGGYDFPGQIAVSDGSEGNGSMTAGFIVLENPTTTGSIRVVRTEEDTDSTRVEMIDLPEVLIGEKMG